LQDYRKLLVAPINLRAHMEALIHREIEHQRRGRRGHLIFKMNALVDQQMIKLLYQASQAGVQVDLLVRGMCCLRPQVAGLSDTIRVTSLVGRFLEHSRIFYFRHGGEEEVYLGSADLMTRNLDRRVEVLFPVEDARILRYLRDTVLTTYLADNAKTRVLRPDGTYESLHPAPGKALVNSQTLLLSRAAG
jgi:polyphosphate kinase